MAVLPPSCIPGLTKTERYYQLYQALGGESDCFFGLTLIEQLRLILTLIGSEECIYTEWDFYAAWLEILDPGACTAMTQEYLQQAVYAVLYAEAGDPSLLPPECFFGVPDEDRDAALIAAIVDSEDNLMFDLTELTISGAGETQIARPTSLLRTVILNIEDGNFTATFPITEAGAVTGMKVDFYLNWTVFSRATIEIFSGSIAGTELFTFTPTNSSSALLHFVFNGTEWESAGSNLVARGIDPLSDVAFQLEAYWRFENGALLVDTSGNGHTLTNTNSVTNPSDGKIGYGAAFVAASSQRLSVNSDLMGGLGEFTFGGWVKDIAANMAIAGSLSFYFGTVAANTSQLVAVTGGNAFFVNGAAIPNDGAYHLVMGWKTNDTLYISVDNEVPASAAMAGTVDAAAFFRLGNGGDGNNYLTGTLDEIAFWPRVLSSEERDTFYNAGAGVIIPV